MEERNEMEKMIIDDVMPGFRFHPTDEELVDFYLKRKIQHKSLPIELIKQLDIYKYDPWDLPMVASTGEKEWYFYCPRDRKYRNSARPNRVTRAGFWKATGTDRPIYSSEGKCIGLKKSLVFYRGRAAKGIKTDWMMHEFRLPSVSDSSPSPKKFSDKSLPANESWAICRIFKKTNSISMAQKAALSQTWISQLPGTISSSDILTNCHQFTSENNIIPCTTESPSPSIQFCSNTSTFSPSDQHIIIPTYKPVSNGDINPDDNFIFYTPTQSTGPTRSQTIDASSILPNNDFMGFEGSNQDYSGFSISVPQENVQETEQEGWRKNHGSIMQLENVGRTIGFPFNLPPNDVSWNNNKGHVAWDLPSFQNEISTSKCYT